MTLREAILSSKQFKRPDWAHWAEAAKVFICFHNPQRLVKLTIKDLIATDYITKEPTNDREQGHT